MGQILVAEDDDHTRRLVSTFLGEHGFIVSQAKDGLEALSLLKEKDFNIAIIDIMMPHVDGFEVTKEISTHYKIPIIMLTAKSQLRDKEKGFRLGVDDYVVKPFELKELLFRIRALLRRSNQLEKMVIILGSTTINKMSYEVTLHDQTLLLPLKEFELLFLLASHPNQVMTREQLIHHVWGSQYKGSDRTVDVHIKRLRDKFSPLTKEFVIQTVRGVGYTLRVS